MSQKEVTMRTSYEERAAIIEEAVRRLGQPATVAELHDELKGDGRFGKPRRIAATFRYDQDPKRRRYPQSVLVRQGRDRIALRRAR